MRTRPLSHRARRSRFAYRTIVVLLLCGSTITPSIQGVLASTSGQWSPLQPDPLPGVPIHMALVRGDGAPFHSRVVWWGAEAGHMGVLGWKAESADCDGFPDTVLTSGNLVPMPFSTPPPTQNLFCGGQTLLATGELLSVGGSDATLEGLRDAFTYSPAAGIAGGSWTPRTAMGQHRWYPTTTVLRDGRVLVAAGHKYDHVWSYGGRRDGGFPSGANAYLLDRCGRIPRGNWDPAAPTVAAVPADGLPPPREGHSLVHMDALEAPFMFGGRGSDGNPVPSEVWYLARETGGATDADYEYPWTRVPDITGELPAPRSEHIAVAVSGNDMIVFGGLTKNGGTETALNDLWRLSKDVSGWNWSQVETSGDPPSARLGHAAVYDEHTYLAGTPSAFTVRRLIVFGGTAHNQPATDSDVHVFTFDPDDFGQGAWTTHSLTGGPGARYDHTMTLTPHPWNPPGRRIAWIYGGRDSSDPPDLGGPIWRLNLDADDPGGISWSSFTPDADQVRNASPGHLSGHAAIYDPVINRLSFLGGSTATPADRHVFQLNNALPYDTLSTTVIPDWGRGEEMAVALSNHAMAFDPTALDQDASFVQAFARIPEIYTPGTGGGSWAVLDDAARAPNYYPVNFLVPRVPFSATTCRVVEVGDDRPTRYLDIPTSGSTTGPWQVLGAGINGFDPDPDFNASTGVMYQPGRILIAGGTTLGGATKLAATLDVAGTTGWVAAPSMDRPRYYHNLVLLPTGGVLAVGGLVYIDPNPKKFEMEDAVLIPEYWEPGATGWTGLSSTNAVVRNYHSTALLLPDGRVLTGGGWGKTGSEPGTHNPYWKKLQLFCPPYLFDANDDPAPRPVIQSAPATIRWRQRFTVCVEDTTGIRSACLIRPGATTHSVDMNQRFVPLTIEGHGGSPQRLFLTAPASPDSAPPGDYMLFLVGTKSGATSYPSTPSIARWVRVQASGDDLCDVVAPAPITGFTADIVGSNQIWFTWTGPGDDGQIPASGPPTSFELSGSSDESLPGLAGSPGSGTVAGLHPCTWYNFTVSAWDDQQQQSTPVALAVETTCGGGGGSGESSAREVSGHEEGGAGSAAGSAPTAGAAPTALAASGRGAAPTVSAANLQSTTGLLVVDTRREGERGWRVTLHLRETPAGADPPLATITVEPGGGGPADTLGRFEPSAAEHLLGLCSLRERGRLGIPGVHRLERVVPGLRTRDGDHALTAALHSRLGPLAGGFLAAGGGVEMVPGDSLELLYTATPAPLADAASWYVLVRRSSDAPPIPMGSRRGRVGETPPARFALHQNRPNPFRGTTTIAFDLPVESPVTLEVFDLLGRRVAVLADATHPSGRHSVEWDLRDLAGARVRPGVYAYRLTAGEYRERRKMNVLE